MALIAVLGGLIVARILLAALETSAPGGGPVGSIVLVAGIVVLGAGVLLAFRRRRHPA